MTDEERSLPPGTEAKAGCQGGELEEGKEGLSKPRSDRNDEKDGDGGRWKESRSGEEACLL